MRLFGQSKALESDLDFVDTLMQYIKINALTYHQVISSNSVYIEFDKANFIQSVNFTFLKGGVIWLAIRNIGNKSDAYINICIRESSLVRLNCDSNELLYKLKNDVTELSDFTSKKTEADLIKEVTFYMKSKNQEKIRRSDAKT